MKLAVPFYKQTANTNCGPVALKMVLEYLGETFSTEELEEKTELKEGKATSTLNLAKAAVDSGFPIRLLSKSILPVPENLNSEFHKKFLEDDFIKKVKKLLDYLKEKNVEMVEKSIKLKELLSYVTENSVPIVPLDWNVLFPRYGGYNGHFVPVVGYDEENVYVHNHGMRDTQEFMPINKELFDKARKAKGTDEDILIIYRKQNI
jgi:hypothetical protein